MEPTTLDEIAAHIKVLRERRESLPELRDYKPQKAKAAAKEKGPSLPLMDDTPAEEIFAGLFTTEEASDGPTSTDAIEHTSPTHPGPSDNGLEVNERP